MNAQVNLVSNPSFEVYINCPTSSAQISLAVPWVSPTISTPDYFNACASGSVNIPNNTFGFEYAKDGFAYAGVYTYNFFSTEDREYIQVQLTDSLKKGQLYCVKFYVSLADYSQYSTNTIGAYFSKIAISGSNYKRLPYAPQIVNDSTIPLTDTLGWTLISGSFIADGGEQYMTIGNFNTDATSAVKYVGSSNPGFKASYYYIDSVTVIECDTTITKVDSCGEVFIPNAFSPDGNSINDLVCVYGNCIATMQLVIYDRWGEKVFETTDPKLCWDGTYKGKLLNTGVFMYYFNATLTTGKQITKKGNISLIR